MAKSDVSGFTALTDGSLEHSAISVSRPNHLPPADEDMPTDDSAFTPVIFGSVAAAEISSGSSKAITHSPTPTSGRTSVYTMTSGTPASSRQGAAASEDSSPAKYPRITTDAPAPLPRPSTSSRSRPPTRAGTGASFAKRYKENSRSSSLSAGIHKQEAKALQRRVEQMKEALHNVESARAEAASKLHETEVAWGFEREQRSAADALIRHDQDTIGSLQQKIHEISYENENLKEQLAQNLHVAQVQARWNDAHSLEIHDMRQQRTAMEIQVKTKDAEYKEMMRNMEEKHGVTETSLMRYAQECSELAINAVTSDDKMTNLNKYNENLIASLKEHNDQRSEMMHEMSKVKAELSSQITFNSVDRDTWDQYYYNLIEALNKQLSSSDLKKDKAIREHESTHEDKVKLLQEVKVEKQVHQLTKETLTETKDSLAESEAMVDELESQIAITTKEMTELKHKDLAKAASINHDAATELSPEILAHIEVIKEAYCEQIEKMKVKLTRARDDLAESKNEMSNDMDIIKGELEKAKAAYAGPPHCNEKVPGGEASTRQGAVDYVSPTTERMGKDARSIQEIVNSIRRDCPDSDDDETFMTAKSESSHPKEVGATSVARLSQADTTTDPPRDRNRGNNKMKIPKWPSYSGVTEWIYKIARNAFAMSQFYDQQEIGWVLEVWDKTFEELADTGEARYAYIDGQITQELEDKLPKTLEVEYNSKLKEASKLKKTIMGRQLLKLCIQHFRTNTHMSMVYTYDNVNELQWFGDKRVLEFFKEWEKRH